MKKPDIYIVRKDVNNAKVTISETRFEVKIPLRFSQEQAQSAVNRARAVLEQQWAPGMSTYRAWLFEEAA